MFVLPAKSSFRFMRCWGLVTLVYGSLCFAPVPAAYAQETRNAVYLEAPAAARQSVTEPRIALVIGNTHYGGDNELRNPQNDARDIATALQALGFDVLLRYDRKSSEMVADLHEFADKIKSINSAETVALFYYSGHGIAVKGSNYLVPIGFTLHSESDVEFDALNAQRVLSEMQGAKSAVNVVILDACRSNPFARSKGIGDKGLAFMEAPVGSFIAYATAPGTTASDNDSETNSIYTQELLKWLKVPALKIEEVFKKAGLSVKERSRSAQIPWSESSLFNDFYFHVPTAADVDTVARVTVTVNVPKAKIIIDDTEVEDGSYSLNLGVEKRKTVEIGITAQGYEPWVKRIELLRGRTIPLVVTMTAAATPPPKKTASNSNQPKTRINRKDGAEMILVPSGEFVMGDGRSDNPVHTVRLSSYYLYKNLVTVGMYEKFCKATKRPMPEAPPCNPEWSKKDHPIVMVSWNDAKAYCDWAGVQLPTEAQWEKAARGTDARKYPWGNEWDSSRLCSAASKATGTAPVGSFPAGASPYGLLDMAGNVWQWCEDWYDNQFTGSADGILPDPVNRTMNANKDRVARGGSWKYGTTNDTKTAARFWTYQTNWNDYFGFRCAAPVR